MRCASSVALRTGTLPSTFRSIAREVSVATESYRRIAYRVEHRAIRLGVGHAHGSRKKDMRAIPDPSRVDPWGVDATQLPAQTRVLSTCPGCAGEKKVACPSCAGVGQLRCANCGGGGKVQGQRGPKNCPSCRGRGTQSCKGCRSGRVTCPPCDGLGRAFAWLELERSESMQVRVYPKRGLAQLNPRVEEVADFDAVGPGSAVPLSDDSGWIGSIASASGQPLDPVLTGPGDRVVGQRIQKFESGVHDIGYRTWLGGGTVRVSPGAGVVLPDSDWSGLKRRAMASGAAFVLALLGATIVIGQYVGQHPWFETHGNAGTMRLLGLASAVFVGLWVARLLLVGAARNKVWLGVLAAPVLLGWSGIWMLWGADSPSLEAVVAATEAGNLEEAQAELTAVRSVLGEVEGIAAGDELIAEAQAEREAARKVQEDADHLARVTSATSLALGVSKAKGSWHDEAVALEARAVLRETGSRELERSVEAGDVEELEQLERLLAVVDEELAGSATAERKLAATKECTKADDFACASEALGTWTEADSEAVGETRFDDARSGMVGQLERAVADAQIGVEDLEARVAVLERTIANAKLYEALTQEKAPRRIAGMERAKAKASRKVAARKRSEAQRDARAEKAEARRRKAAERKARKVSKPARSWGGDRVQCCDGTRSPSCTYSRSLRGCCSHHGGVC